MSTLVVALIATIAALAGATGIGVAVNRRSGVLRKSGSAAQPDTSGLGLSDTGPTVLHFSAQWCGPCATVRRVVDQVCADLPGVAHVELDIDANPAAAKRLQVLSLPTTFIFDADGHQRYRTAGVPKAADLRTALLSLSPSSQ
ncbi:thioredoxin family protein [Mycobacterium angelicum]|uniref:Thiol reductase thioredoxin n=1 Tax=Mycobacterium angelicum TaxID=470074 RepID=A0A1W9ZPK4_MYCAN|nr:thioredoxin family protein [Mycobacterium angelicum]MCV7200306.1 thioredoxin family protein [Mycobacterium angelicum]ORA19772.1 thiol reductase thioredoxin [Mycobacterium angelicum]